MFSIIIPVHNVEEYIEQCISSIMDQSYQDFEVILVINASIDSSYAICKKWEYADNRIRVFNTDIAGVSHARNMGIENCNGEWIVFVDSDDYLLKNALQILKDKIDESIDLVIANYTQINKAIKLSDREGIVGAEKCLFALLDSPNYFKNIEHCLTYNADILGVNWAKAFKRDVFIKNKIRFNEKITIFEDFLFNYDFLLKSKMVKCVDTPIYYYRVTQNSLSRTLSKDRILKRIDFINVILDKESDKLLRDVLEFNIMQNILRLIVAMGRKINDYKEVSGIILEFLKQERVKNIILKARTYNLSNGRYQNIVYICILKCLKREWYLPAFCIGAIYEKIKNKD